LTAPANKKTPFSAGFFISWRVLCSEFYVLSEGNLKTQNTKPRTPNFAGWMMALQVFPPGAIGD